MDNHRKMESKGGLMPNRGEPIRVVGIDEQRIRCLMRYSADSGNHRFVLWDGATMYGYSDRHKALLSFRVQGVMREILGPDPAVFSKSEKCLFLKGGPDGSFRLGELIESYRKSEPLKGFEIEGMGWSRLCTEIRHETEARISVRSLSPTKFFTFTQVWFYPDHIELRGENAQLRILHRSVRYRGSSRSKARHIFAQLNKC